MNTIAHFSVRSAHIDLSSNEKIPSILKKNCTKEDLLYNSKSEIYARDEKNALEEFPLLEHFLLCNLEDTKLH